MTLSARTDSDWEGPTLDLIGDKIFHSDPNVTISRTLVRVGATSYPIAGIGGVSVSRPHFDKVLQGGMVGIVAVFGALSGFFDMFLIMLLGCAALGMLVFGMQWVLIFHTASQNHQALVSYDKNYVIKLKDAIEQAVMMRG